MGKKCKHLKRDQPNFAKDLSVLQSDLNWIKIWVCDQDEQNRGNFTGIKNKSKYEMDQPWIWIRSWHRWMGKTVLRGISQF